MRRVAFEAGTVLSHAIPGTKFVRVLAPLKALAALSYAFAPSSAESNVPSHKRIFCVVSLISATHLPDGRCLTPTNLFLLLAPPEVSLWSSNAVSGVLLLSALSTSLSIEAPALCLFILFPPAACPFPVLPWRNLLDALNNVDVTLGFRDALDPDDMAL